MWKPATPNAPATTTSPTPNKEMVKPNMPNVPATSASSMAPANSSEPTPAAAPRNAALNTSEQARIGKSLVIKGEVTGSESLYSDGRGGGSINLPDNRVP